jgi:hypothetical protein
MAQNVFLLEDEYDYDFKLIGISCHEKDYRLCWGVNQKMNISLQRNENDIELIIKKSNRHSLHSSYIFIDDEYDNEYNLLTNRSSMGYLIPEKAQADYLLMIKDENYPISITDVINNLKEITFVLTAFEIEVRSLKSKDNLIF